MNRTRLTTALALCGALVLSACGHKASSSGSGASSASSSGSATVEAKSVSGVGTVLVAGNGRTLYLLTADSPGKSTCTASPCTGAWPPLLLTAGATSPKAGTGVTASLLGTATGSAGATQVTYKGWPLYMYSGDSGAGQANGEGISSFGGTWHAVSPSGQPVMMGGSSPGGGGSPAGGGGY